MILASLDWPRVSRPTPAALATRVYMLSCRWSESERSAVLRGRGVRFISPPLKAVHYPPAQDRESTLSWQLCECSGDFSILRAIF